MPRAAGRGWGLRPAGQPLPDCQRKYHEPGNYTEDGDSDRQAISVRFVSGRSARRPICLWRC